MSKETVCFAGTIPLIKSAILVDGSGGAQVKIEVPECDMPSVKRLMDWRGKVLRVEVIVEDGENKGGEKYQWPQAGQ